METKQSWRKISDSHKYLNLFQDLSPHKIHDTNFQLLEAKIINMFPKNCPKKLARFMGHEKKYVRTPKEQQPKTCLFDEVIYYFGLRKIHTQTSN